MQRILTMAKGPMSISPPYLTWLILFGLAGFVAGGYAPAQAQQFSADLVIIHADGKAAASAGKLRVFNDKARIETPDFADGFFLIDATNRAAYFARPAERVFMDARQSSRLTQMFVPIDLSDPCRQWHDMATLAGATDRNEPWRCERVGEEIIEGRRAAGYRVISTPGRDIVGWIDSDLKFPLRVRTADGATVTAQNIQEGPQPGRLFEIPPGFRKFDPQTLIKRIKQSDVWVDAPPP